MNKTIRNIALCSLALVSLGYAQTTTTTTAAMTRGQDQIYLSSSTGINAAGLGPVTGLYIDHEYMTVAENTATNQWRVKRGVNGLQTGHVSGAVVFVGNPGNFDLGVNDRVGACTGAFSIVQVRSGNVTYCSNGQYGNFTTNGQVGAVLASQAGVMTGAFAITAKVTHISGLAAITGFTVPAGLPDGGQFIIIPDAAFTVTTATNVGAATTAVAGKALVYTYDKTAGKLYPSY